MALLNIFKKKKKVEKKKVEKKVEKKLPERKALKKAEKKPVETEPRPVKTKPKKISVTAYRVLKGPQVTEKASDLTKQNQYVFKVYAGAQKPEIKKTVADVYGVDVVSVKIVNVPAKKRRLGRTEGWRKGYKKAIVKIKPGQKIEVLPR